jgi:hypothetical protein
MKTNKIENNLKIAYVFLFSICYFYLKTGQSTSTANESHSVGWKLPYLSPGSLRYVDVYRRESGRCRTLPFF